MQEQLVQIPIEDKILEGNLTIPVGTKGIVLFAHGSGSSRFSPRNKFVSQYFNNEGLATLLFDLLTPEEEQLDEVNREFRFDIPLLTERLVTSTHWIKEYEKTKHLKIGYFGSSTGAASALIASTKIEINAIVSRGGRVDLAQDYLEKIIAPTLFIVGGKDEEVLALNKKAFEKLNHIKEIAVIPNASHLFEEPGKLEDVAKIAAGWFTVYLH